MNLNSYKLSKQWFDFAFENPEKISVSQSALYFWLIELNNRNKWKPKFPFNTEDAGEATGMKNKKTVWKALNELVSNGFVLMVFKSGHRHKATYISLPILNPEQDEKDIYQSNERSSKETVNEITEPFTEPKNGTVNGVTEPFTEPKNGAVSEVTEPFTEPKNGHSYKHSNNNNLKEENILKETEKGKDAVSPPDFSESPILEFLKGEEFLEEPEASGEQIATLTAKKKKNSTQGGAVTKVCSPEEINSRITSDVNALKAKLKETSDEPEKKLLRKQIIALEGKYIVQLPFDSEEFALEWEKWIVFKQKTKSIYGTVRGQQEALHELNEKAQGIEETAIQIIEQSINRGWKTFYELKNKAISGNTANPADRLKVQLEQLQQRDSEMKADRMQMMKDLNLI